MAAKTQQDFLDLFDRLLPQAWLAPLQAPGPGYEMLQAWAALGARLSLMEDRIRDGSYFVSAAGAVFATAAVTFSRTGTAAVVLKGGSELTCSLTGHIFKLQADVTWPALDVADKAGVAVAQLPGWHGNVTGPVTTADGTVLPGEIDTLSKALQDPPYADTTITVAQDADATGGISPMLDLLGLSRGLTRFPGELDADYKIRCTTLLDTVSPGAVIRFLASVFAKWGHVAQFSEEWDVTWQTCWDAPGVSVNNFDTNLFTYDDNRPAYPMRNRWLDEVEQHGAFVCVVPNLGAMRDCGMGFDDTAMNPAQHVSADTKGLRGWAAFDVPNTATSDMLAGGYDGFDLPKQGVYSGLWDNLQAIKAAGVAAIVELAGQ